ncbi:ribonuclease H-like domain-containing protein [Fodinibius saliphilus]|uniref:ribonuclease H-like domain-containing protein n=1 Tax=Fodinibius saliphilus TaxID=1920650 RepID=UPI001108C8BB|nr:ribonuclease H-like domain-containing protein [Fodinibius saliphilus]
MSRKYLAFDIETAKILPEDFDDLHAHRPLGISCAATWCADEDQPEVFFSSSSNRSHAPKMSPQDLFAFIKHLEAKVDEGYTIVTHNGLGFDFDILGEESGQWKSCRNLARNHVDMMYHFFCGKGFPIGLNAAAKAIGISKPADVDGSVAPQLWKDGEYKTVLDYVAQDCRLTLDVAEASEKNGQISWITRRGTKSSYPLPSGWLTVKEASELPLPDTSWMDNPWSRSKFTDWLEH